MGYDLSRSDEDAHDHIGSSTTPSGAATPRPDPSDKRLPSIMSGYFGQVRNPSTTKSIDSGLCTVTSCAPSTGNECSSPKHHGRFEGPGGALPTAPSTPDGDMYGGEEHAPPLLSHERLGQAMVEVTPENSKSSSCSTVPSNSPLSLRQRVVESGENTSNVARSVISSEAGRPSYGRQQSATDVIPLRTRRLTADFRSLSGVITISSVHAAHISNPTTTPSTPSTPLCDTPQISAFSSLASSLELAKLTDSVAPSPRQKNTPPHTPRALSNDGIETVHRLLAPTSNSTLSPIDDPARSPTLPDNSTTHGSRTPQASHNTPPVGPPKGKLSINISEARGLRPSLDPYVVCVFEWNEDISQRPKQEEISIEHNDSKSREEGLGGVPIKRLGSDMGRSMAIPMKSRQSSTASLSEQKSFKTGRQVTDPKWEHEVTL